MSTETKHKWLGELLNDRYRIESLIGSGGMSDVYLATDTHLTQSGVSDCKVALKILKPDAAKETASLELLARETAKTRQLSHPNIVRVQDLERDGDTWFMVMEFLEGEPLSRIIQRSRPTGLKKKGVERILDQVISALKYSHRQNVVHADLKPSNIFFTKGGDVKLLDFGVSRALSGARHEDFLNPGKDDTSIYGYTPAYTLPEFSTEGRASIKADIYALACISFELFSSRHPFDRKPLTLSERCSYKLERPKNMPHKTWLTIKRQLLGDEAVLSLSQLEQALKPYPWVLIGQTAAMVTAFGLAIAGWQFGYAESSDAAEQLRRFELAEKAVDDIKSLPPEKLIDSLGRLSEVQRAGVLKLRQNDLVQSYLDRMEKALEPSETTGLPNTPEALDLASMAIELFPRDREILQFEEQVQRRQASLRQAISEEIASILDQGDFKTQKNLEDLEQLAANLEFLGGTMPQPSDKANGQFNRQSLQALEANDLTSQPRLLSVGNRFFKSTPQVQATLERLSDLKDDVRTLSQYFKQVEAGESELIYPASAARTVYAPRLESWEEAIADSKSRDDLDAIYEDMSSVKEQIPEDLDIIVAMEKRLADAYLALAETLLAQNNARQAQPLMKRATELMR